MDLFIIRSRREPNVDRYVSAWTYDARINRHVLSYTDRLELAFEFPSEASAESLLESAQISPSDRRREFLIVRSTIRSTEGRRDV